jgi:5S rRNA maturation endonuclease (ribonuclease M5)
MHQNQADFKHLKEHVSIEQILTHYGVQLRPAGPGNLRGRCPLPTHTSRVSTESFSVNLVRNVWSCQSASCVAARGGQLGGNVLDLVATMERCSIRDAGLRMQDWFATSLSNPAPARYPSESVAAEPNPPLKFVLHKVDYWHPYLAERGIHVATAKTFGVGVYSGDGFLSGRLVIPIQDHAGQLVAYAGRSIAGEEPKYRFPTGFRKSQVLFNFNRAIHSGKKNAIVVEGFFDAMKVYQAGHSNVVALMGSTFSQRQSDLLTDRFESVTLMLDGDVPGRRAADMIAKSLESKMPVKRVDVGDGRQPDQMRSPEINALVGPARCRTYSMGR